MDPVENVLAHYGVLGMKWGQRKQRRAEAASDDHKALTAVRQKAKKDGKSALSNTDLQKAIQRMQLENQYNDLVRRRKLLNRGTNVVKSLIGMGKTVNDAYSLANSPVVKNLKNN